MALAAVLFSSVVACSSPTETGQHVTKTSGEADDADGQSTTETKSAKSTSQKSTVAAETDAKGATSAKDGAAPTAEELAQANRALAGTGVTTQGLVDQGASPAMLMDLVKCLMGGQDPTACLGNVFGGALGNGLPDLGGLGALLGGQNGGGDDEAGGDEAGDDDDNEE